MRPNAKNVVQVAEVEGGLQGAFFKGFLLPLAHVKVGVGRGKSLTHGCPIDLQIKLVIEEEVIVIEAEIDKL